MPHPSDVIGMEAYEALVRGGYAVIREDDLVKLRRIRYWLTELLVENGTTEPPVEVRLPRPVIGNDGIGYESRGSVKVGI